jgi:hypothetical protein
MAANQPSEDRQWPASTFSLRTLFLILTTSGVFFAVMRVSNAFLAASASLAFLWVWSLLTGHEQRASYAGIAAIVSLTLLPFVPDATDRGSHRMQCMNNLKQIGLALLDYHQKYGSFPPAYVADANGKPLYSWRMLILPELDNNNLAGQLRLDEAWDGPNNSKLTQTALPVFNCPSDVRSGGWPSSMTSYVAVVGPNTAWSGATPRKVSDFKNPGGTILVVEIANSGIHWAEPRDLYIGQMPLAINPPFGQGISSNHAIGVNAVFVDASVHSLQNPISPKTLAELLDLDGCSDGSAY